MKRLIVLFSLLVVALAGCSSSSSPSSSSAPATTAGAVSSPAETVAPPTTPAPVAGGTATDFCGAFQELQAVSETPTGDLATVGAQFRAAATDMRTFAPAEILQAATTYADVMDAIGKAAQGGTIDQAALSTAIADALTGNSSDIGTVAVWVAQNCSF
ncbi:hypothetical protein [Cellulomonas sp. P24]|uniref:hypothetical protein n=1 Tax=Cellulomonas sp. P24 TaxID=2885206 RepID=UPI00216ACE18|nr:hypothetical protein [Cellulomonas sp. P24]MCR6491620.1 hypothetical protein [Cellulomonas sp. P24]